MELDLPADLTDRRRSLLDDTAARLDSRYGDDLLGLVLSGSAGRGLATAGSDLDLLVVLTADAAADPTMAWSHTAELEEIPLTLDHVETVAPFGTGDYAYRWSYAWAPVLLDRTGGRIPAALYRHTHLSPAETRGLLIDHEQLGHWLNLTFRALKSARVGRSHEARLDSVEALPAFLDIVFALDGLVRPYNSYLVWALTHHPLPSWNTDELLDLIERLLDGDRAALRSGVAQVHDRSLRFAADHDDPRIVHAFQEWYPDDYGDVLGLP